MTKLERMAAEKAAYGLAYIAEHTSNQALRKHSYALIHELAEEFDFIVFAGKASTATVPCISSPRTNSDS